MGVIEVPAAREHVSGSHPVSRNTHTHQGLVLTLPGHAMPLSLRCVAFAAAVLLAAAPAASTLYSRIGKFGVSNPGYVFVRNITGDRKADLVITQFQFNPAKTGAVSFVDNIGGNLRQIRAGNPLYVDTITQHLFWPNDIKVAPQGIWDADKTLLVADGFLLAGKTPGNLVALPLDVNGQAKAAYSLTGPLTNTSNYGTFHALAKFVDLRGKGTPRGMDIIATKVHESIFGPKHGFLVARLQPPDPTQQWSEVVLADGPDFAFETRSLGNQTLVVWAGSFFEGWLKVYMLDTSVYPPQVRSNATVDAASGPVYSIQLVDLDGDGEEELLVSNHQPSPESSPPPSVFAYKIPRDASRYGDPSAYKRFTLASGFACYKAGTGKAAPGWPFPFRPNAGPSGGAMDILLSGDDNGGFYILSPNATKGILGYDMQKLAQYPGTVGKPEVADVDGDGWVELFLPDYEGNSVQVFTAKPQH